MAMTTTTTTVVMMIMILYDDDGGGGGGSGGGGGGGRGGGSSGKVATFRAGDTGIDSRFPRLRHASDFNTGFLVAVLPGVQRQR